jgi:hypothetical protein
MKYVKRDQGKQRFKYAQVSASIYHRFMYVLLQTIYSSSSTVMMPSERYVGNDIYKECAKK